MKEHAMPDNQISTDLKTETNCTDPELRRIEERHGYSVEKDIEGDGWNLVRDSDAEVIFCDSMEPEDALLVRDLRPLVDELNRVGTEKSALLARLRTAEEQVRIWEDAWYQDETIAPDGELRPTLEKTVHRRG